MAKSESEQALEVLNRLAAAIEAQAQATTQAVAHISLLLDVLAGDEEQEPPKHL